MPIDPHRASTRANVISTQRSQRTHKKCIQRSSALTKSPHMPCNEARMERAFECFLLSFYAYALS